MIITRTPFRISFFGGGTDYPIWYRENGGKVLSTSVNKYCYINCRYLPPYFEYKYRIRYSHREETKSIQEINHPSVRSCLDYLNIGKGVEIVHTGDIPALSGMGSSSAFTVGLLHSLYALKGNIVTKRQLAREAIHIEQNVIKENVGSQDQVACAFGGFNVIEFGGEKEFYVYPVTISKERLDFLQQNLMLFFTGFSRRASDIAGEQIKETPKKVKELNTMGAIVDEAIKVLNNNANDLGEFGKLLHETWIIKRGLTDVISTEIIDHIYEAARGAGAVGGKLLGAGGGGFIIFFAPPEKQNKIKETLKNLLCVPFRFENLGTQIIMYSTQEIY